MFGVVLWSDREKKRAVIWCEDHRNLAFFRQDSETVDGGDFVPGDLVEFDLREENELRLAIDPCLVAPHEYPSLAQELRSACAGIARKQTSPPRRDAARDPADDRVVVLHPRATPQRARLREQLSIA